jgi:ankyrin repeat protein
VRRPTTGTTLLHLASTANLTDVVEHLASAGDVIHKVDDNEETAFHAAAQRGHVEVGEILHGKGANYDAQSKSGITPLSKAARQVMGMLVL